MPPLWGQDTGIAARASGSLMSLVVFWGLSQVAARRMVGRARTGSLRLVLDRGPSRWVTNNHTQLLRSMPARELGPCSALQPPTSTHIDRTSMGRGLDTPCDDMEAEATPPPPSPVEQETI